MFDIKNYSDRALNSQLDSHKKLLESEQNPENIKQITDWIHRLEAELATRGK